MTRRVVAIVGDHHAIGPRDLCGFSSRLYMELSSRDDTCWCVLGGGSSGGIRSVKDSLAQTIAEMVSYDVDEYDVIIWAGVGEAKSGGIPFDAWRGMLEHMISMCVAADMNVGIVLPVIPPSDLIDKHMRRWFRRVRGVAIEVAKSKGIRSIDLSLDRQAFVDLYALSARAYQSISKDVADQYFFTKRKAPRPADTEIIYKRKKPSNDKISEPTKKTEDNTIVIMQPDRVKGSGRNDE